MLANPYSPGELPRVLAGREEQQNRIRGYLSRLGTYGEMGGPLLVFQGPRGVGKTSLLREAQRDAEGHGFITAWVSCRRNAPFLPDLVSRIGKAIETADILPRAEKGRWGLRLERIGVEIGMPSVVKVSASASADRSEGDAPRGARISALEDLLHETSRQVRGRGGAGLVVFVDELHAAARDDLAVLLNAMQNLAGKREDNPFAVIGAGLPSRPLPWSRRPRSGSAAPSSPSRDFNPRPRRRRWPSPRTTWEFTGPPRPCKRSWRRPRASLTCCRFSHTPPGRRRVHHVRALCSTSTT